MDRGDLILDGLNLTIQRGSFWGVIGPNGAGKTTLLRLLLGLIKPRRGSIKIMGTKLHNLGFSQRAKLTAYVSQDIYYQFPFTVREVVLMGRYPHLKNRLFEGKNDRQIAEKYMDMLGISGFANRYLYELSAGERQRVQIARALAQQAPCLLLDEAASHLDINYQQAIGDLLEQLNEKEKMTMVFISHDLNLAARYCERLLLLGKQATAYEIGTPEGVLTSQTIKQYFGCEVKVANDPFSGKPHIYLPGDGG